MCENMIYVKFHSLSQLNVQWLQVNFKYIHCTYSGFRKKISVNFMNKFVNAESFKIVVSSLETPWFRYGLFNFCSISFTSARKSNVSSNQRCNSLQSQMLEISYKMCTVYRFKNQILYINTCSNVLQILRLKWWNFLLMKRQGENKEF